MNGANYFFDIILFQGKMGQLSINRPGGFSRAVNATLVSYTRIRRATGINEDELRSRHKVVVLFHFNNTMIVEI